MFSKRTVWQFLFSALILPVFVGIEAASASVPEQTEESSYIQQTNQSLVEIEDNTIEEDLTLPQVQFVNIDVDSNEIDNDEIDQRKNGYYQKPRRQKRSYYKRSSYKRYNRPCRTYYRPKKSYRRVRNNRYKYGNAGYQRYPKRNYNNGYGY
ncbi:MAG: hypothetical protein AAF208_04925 [Cyanobacteria bacterium P01_A01_bin.45]